MATVGNVRFWHSDMGWGAIDSDETPGGCWAHFTHIRADADTAARGFRDLKKRQPVEFIWERFRQDGYEFRAIAVWPATGAHRSD